MDDDSVSFSQMPDRLADAVGRWIGNVDFALPSAAVRVDDAVKVETNGFDRSFNTDRLQQFERGGPSRQDPIDRIMPLQPGSIVPRLIVVNAGVVRMRVMSSGESQPAAQMTRTHFSGKLRSGE